MGTWSAAAPAARITQPLGFTILLMGSVCFRLVPVVTGFISAVITVSLWRFFSLPMSVVSVNSSKASSRAALSFSPWQPTTSRASFFSFSLSDMLFHLKVLGIAISMKGLISISYLRPMINGAGTKVDLVSRAGFSGAWATTLRTAGFLLLQISVWQMVSFALSATAAMPLMPRVTPVSRAAALTLAPSTKNLLPSAGMPAMSISIGRARAASPALVSSSAKRASLSFSTLSTKVPLKSAGFTFWTISIARSSVFLGADCSGKGRPRKTLSVAAAGAGTGAFGARVGNLTGGVAASTRGSQMSSVISTEVALVLAGGPGFTVPPFKVNVKVISSAFALALTPRASRSTPAVSWAPVNLLSVPSNFRAVADPLGKNSMLTSERVKIPVPSYAMSVLSLSATAAAPIPGCETNATSLSGPSTGSGTASPAAPAAGAALSLGAAAGTTASGAAAPAGAPAGAASAAVTAPALPAMGEAAAASTTICGAALPFGPARGRTADSSTSLS